MSMSKEECLHDCTCCARREIRPDYARPPVDDAVCDLPEGHTGPHWDPLYGQFQ